MTLRKISNALRSRDAERASFMHDDLGYIDLAQRTLQTIATPFGTRLSLMS